MYTQYLINSAAYHDPKIHNLEESHNIEICSPTNYDRNLLHYPYKTHICCPHQDAF